VFNILLQILDDGRLTDAKGRRVDFRNTIIIMTSNIGTEAIRRDGRFGFVTSSTEDEARSREYDRMKERVLGELKNIFRPEFLNRIDATIAFHPLEKEQIRQIVDLMLKRVEQELVEQEMRIEVTLDAKDFLVEKGFDTVFGARPLRRAIQNHIEDPLAEALLEGRFHRGDMVLVDAQNGELVMTRATEEALVETA